MRNREMLLNGALLGAIVLLGALTMLYGVRGESDLPDLSPGARQAIAALGSPGDATILVGPETLFGTETGYAPAPPTPAETIMGPIFDPAAGDRFAHLLARNPFETIIPKPTPAPTPVPTPVPPPPLAEFVGKWQISGIMAPVVYFTDEGENFFEMEVGGPARKVDHGTFVADITVVRVDDRKFEVELKSNLHSETLVKKMFQ